MKIIGILLICLLAPLFQKGATARGFADAVQVNTTEKPLKNDFSGVFFNDENGVWMYLDLQEEKLEVPDMPFLGHVAGYMNGKIYGVWILIKYEIKRNKVILRFTNDIGADSQTISLTRNEDGSYWYEAINGNMIKRVEGRKLVKITGSMLMKKKQ
ncbi:hypothetical protein EII14_01980 [Alloprevotella sp. OH1205_COT-284]|uniref:hypothetical protein n=1 Tax=Alloprevotella sp. OH1205_COT-284 TaxID=2491043 RepID=UPI000F5FDE82|nr:hypothetical protein [Alloprevotella sp. OH1205_COT-284]RRD80410.1 hypothetical protein EII14_01980 [Alloprevotella sp. OH1205_COT-284]